MSSKLTYLSNYSQAVYETTLIDNFERQNQGLMNLQVFRFVLLCGGFISLAAMALVIPLCLEDFLRALMF